LIQRLELDTQVIVRRSPPRHPAPHPDPLPLRGRGDRGAGRKALPGRCRATV